MDAPEIDAPAPALATAPATAPAPAKRARCAVCTTKNNNCKKKCEYAPYFPAERMAEYESANELFGTPNIIRMIKAAPEEEKHQLASSILMEGDAWTKDPVKGGFGEMQKLMWEIELRKAYLRELEEKIKEVKEKTELRL